MGGGKWFLLVAINGIIEDEEKIETLGRVEQITKYIADVLVAMSNANSVLDSFRSKCIFPVFIPGKEIEGEMVRLLYRRYGRWSFGSTGISTPPVVWLTTNLSTEPSTRSRGARGLHITRWPVQSDRRRVCSW